MSVTMEPKAQDQNCRDGCAGVVTFSEGLVGLPFARHFTFEASDEIAPFMRMRCQDPHEISFLVVDPRLVVSDYRPAWGDDVRDVLELEEAAAALVLVVATISPRIEECTANLLAPLVINPKRLRGRQIVLDIEAHSARHPLVGTLR